LKKLASQRNSSNIVLSHLHCSQLLLHLKPTDPILGSIPFPQMLDYQVSQTNKLRDLL
jgi:hypothetical protein